MIRACIFDFDGILADTEELHYLSYQEALEPEGLGFDSQTYAARYIAFDSKGCFRQLLRDHGRKVDDVWITDRLAAKNEAYDRLVRRADLKPLPGALDAVRLAAERGPVAVCTGAERSDVDPLLDSFGLTSLLDAVVTADDVSVSKPDPESYALAARRLNTPPGDCLAIEDTPGGLRSAAAAGCHTLGITTSFSRSELTEIAERVGESLADFSDLLNAFDQETRG